MVGLDGTCRSRESARGYALARALPRGVTVEGGSVSGDVWETHFGGGPEHVTADTAIQLPTRGACVPDHHVWPMTFNWQKQQIGSRRRALGLAVVSALLSAASIRWTVGQQQQETGIEPGEAGTAGDRPAERGSRGPRHQCKRLFTRLTRTSAVAARRVGWRCSRRRPPAKKEQSRPSRMTTITW